MSLPLDGIRILDLTRLLPGPLCSMMLADLGAEIIKVEAPQGGDYARWFPPMKQAMSGAFVALNRNKRSLALDLKQPQGAAILKRMVRQADVVLEGFRPGVMERLGLGYEALRQENESLIYCAISGYGQTGPLAKKAGHDINYLARTGILSLLGGAGELPQVCGVQIADVAGGSLSAVSHLLAALFRRERTGQGAFCDVSMSEGVLPFLAMALGEWSAGGPMPTRGQGALRGEAPCYRVYPCQDGTFLAVGALEPKFWTQFVMALGVPELATEGWEEGEAGEKVAARISSLLVQRTRDEWIELFAKEGLDVCVEPVWSLEEAKNDPHAQARGYFPTMEHPTEGSIQMVRSPFQIEGAPPQAATPAPLLGQHSLEVLRDFDFSDEEVESYLQDGVIEHSPESE